jgi:hypothetical protein
MSSQRRTFKAGRWIVIAIAAMAIAGTAVALGAVQRRGATTLPPSTSGSARAKCDHGRVALAAGFASPGFDPNTSNGGPAVRFDSELAGKRAVKTVGFNFSDTDPRELDSFAYCGKRARPPEVASKDVQVAPNTYGSVVAKCPKGSQAIAGGFGTDKSVITLTSKRSGTRGWKAIGVDIANSTGSSEPTLTAYAYCKAPGRKLVTRSKDATVTSSGFRTTTVSCPNGGKALSGGFDGHVSAAGGMLTASGALDSKRIDHGHGWATSALSVSPNQAEITTYAYCHR